MTAKTHRFGAARARQMLPHSRSQSGYAEFSARNLPRCGGQPTQHNSTSAQRERDAMSPTDLSVPRLLRKRACRQPDAEAFRFGADELGATALPESLTWRQLFQRSSLVADEFEQCGDGGDRVAAIIPRGLSCTVALLATLQTGFITVPHSVPELSNDDKHISNTLRVASTAVI